MCEEENGAIELAIEQAINFSFISLQIQGMKQAHAKAPAHSPICW